MRMPNSRTSLVAIVSTTLFLSGLLPACGEKKDEEEDEAGDGAAENGAPSSGDQPNTDQNEGQSNTPGGDDGDGLPEVGEPTTFRLVEFDARNVKYHNSRLYNLVPEDAQGAFAARDTDITFTVTMNDANSIVHANSGDLTPAATITLPANSSAASFYVYGVEPGQTSITISSSDPTFEATIAETVELLPVAKIESAAYGVQADQCALATFSIVDEHNAPTVFSRSASETVAISLDSGVATFYSDSDCTASLTALTFAADQSGPIVAYLKASTDSVVRLTELTSTEEHTFNIDVP